MKIALVGTTASNAYAPVDDTSWQIWGIGERQSHIHRADRWFELHKLEVEGRDWAEKWRKEEMVKWKGCKVYMFFPEVAEGLGLDVVRLDPKPLQEKYGTFFMTSSFAWMMALAIEEKPEEIGIWGVDLDSDAEYKAQRSGVRHFIYLAQALGIKVYRAPMSSIAHEPVPYPFNQNDPLIAKTRLQRIQTFDKYKKAAAEEDRLTTQLQRVDGARQELSLLLAGQVNAKVVSERLKQLGEESVRLQTLAIEAAKEAKMQEGSLKHINWLEGYLT